VGAIGVLDHELEVRGEAAVELHRVRYSVAIAVVARGQDQWRRIGACPRNAERKGDRRRLVVALVAVPVRWRSGERDRNRYTRSLRRLAVTDGDAGTILCARLSSPRGRRQQQEGSPEETPHNR